MNAFVEGGRQRQHILDFLGEEEAVGLRLCLLLVATDLDSHTAVAAQGELPGLLPPES